MGLNWQEEKIAWLKSKLKDQFYLSQRIVLNYLVLQQSFSQSRGKHKMEFMISLYIFVNGSIFQN